MDGPRRWRRSERNDRRSPPPTPTRDALDEAFERRVTLESGLKEAEAQLERLQRDVRSKVDALPGGKRAEYDRAGT